MKELTCCCVREADIATCCTIRYWTSLRKQTLPRVVQSNGKLKRIPARTVEQATRLSHGQRLLLQELAAPKRKKAISEKHSQAAVCGSKSANS